MTTDKYMEALKLALGALENTTPLGFNMESDKRFYAAITAIREALASKSEALAEQGCDYCNHPQYAGTKCKNCGREQPAPVAEPHKQHEPVAVYVGETWCGSVVRLYDDLPLETPLYTSPPYEATPLANANAGQRSVKPWVYATTWRGLTEEEKANLFEGTAPYYNEADYADAIEAKLRELNEHKEKNA